MGTAICSLKRLICPRRNEISASRCPTSSPHTRQPPCTGNTGSLNLLTLPLSSTSASSEEARLKAVSASTSKAETSEWAGVEVCEGRVEKATTASLFLGKVCWTTRERGVGEERGLRVEKEGREWSIGLSLSAKSVRTPFFLLLLFFTGMSSPLSLRQLAHKHVPLHLKQIHSSCIPSLSTVVE